MTDVIYADGQEFAIHSESIGPVTVIETDTPGPVTVIEVTERGPQGLPGILVDTIYVEAGENIGGQRVVALDDSTNKAVYADNVTDYKRIVGVSRAAVVTGENVSVVSYGEMEDPAWAWDESKGLFLGSNGLIVQGVPATGAIVSIGFPMSPTKIFITIDTFIERT